MEIKKGKQSGAVGRIWFHGIMHLADRYSRRNVAQMGRLAGFWHLLARLKRVTAGFSTHGSRPWTIAVGTARAYSIPILNGKPVAQPVGRITRRREISSRLLQGMAQILPQGGKPARLRYQSGREVLHGGPEDAGHPVVFIYGSLIDLPQASSGILRSRPSWAQAYEQVSDRRESVCQ